MRLGVRLRTLLCCLFLLCSSNFLFAEHTGWKWLGPSGGGIDEIIPVPADPAIWLVKKDQLYITRDFAKTWKPTGIPYVACVVVHPVTSTIYVVNLRNFLFISKDLGKTFHLQTQIQGLAAPIRIQINPYEPGALYITGDQIRISKNDGKTWFTFTPKSPIDITKQYGSYQGHPCYIESFGYGDIVFLEKNSSEMLISGGPLYTCTYAYRDVFDPFLMITKNFSDWQILERRKDEYDFRLVLDPFLPGHFLVQQVGDLYEFKQDHLNLLSSFQSLALAFVRGNPAELFAVTYKNERALMVRSIDGGRTWFIFHDQNHLPMKMVQVINRNPLVLIAGCFTDQGILRWDPASGWLDSNQSFSGYPTVVQSAGQYLYAVSESFRMKKDGDEWIDLTNELHGITRNFAAITVNPQRPSRLFVNGQHAFYQSDDAGYQWRKRSKTPYEVVGFDPQDANALYLVDPFDSGHVYKADVRSFSPQQLPLTFKYPVGIVQTHPFNPNLIFYQTSGMYYKSADGGQSIQEFKLNKQRVYFVAFQQNPQSYFIMTSDFKIYETKNSGQTFSPLPANIPLFGIWNCDPSGQTLLSFGKGKLYKSKDLARTWHNISVDLPSAIENFSCSERSLFVGTDNGVYKNIQTAAN